MVTAKQTSLVIQATGTGRSSLGQPADGNDGQAVGDEAMELLFRTSVRLGTGMVTAKQTSLVIQATVIGRSSLGQVADGNPCQAEMDQALEFLFGTSVGQGTGMVTAKQTSLVIQATGTGRSSLGQPRD